MSGLLDKNGKPVREEFEPKASCSRCCHVAPISRFLGDEPDDDKCPRCGGKHWEFL